MADKYQDLKEQYDVRLEQGLDAFVVVDGLPIVPEESKPKLVKFVVKKLNAVGKVKEDGFFMPVNDQGKTEGYVTTYIRLNFELTHTVTPLSNIKLHSRLLQLQSSSTAPLSIKSTLSPLISSQISNDMVGKDGLMMNTNHHILKNFMRSHIFAGG